MFTRSFFDDLDRFKDDKEIASLVEQLKAKVADQKTQEKKKREEALKERETLSQKIKDTVKELDKLRKDEEELSKDVAALELVVVKGTHAFSDTTLNELRDTKAGLQDDLKKLRERISEKEKFVKESSKKLVEQQLTLPFVHDSFQDYARNLPVFFI